MLLPNWLLLSVSGVLGASGAVLAYKKRWAAVIPTIAVLCISAATIVESRDTLGLTPQSQLIAQGWGFVAALLWSNVVGLTLPAIGLYLGSRRK